MGYAFYIFRYYCKLKIWLKCYSWCRVRLLFTKRFRLLKISNVTFSFRIIDRKLYSGGIQFCRDFHKVIIFLVIIIIIIIIHHIDSKKKSVRISFGIVTFHTYILYKREYFPINFFESILRHRASECERWCCWWRVVNIYKN